MAFYEHHSPSINTTLKVNLLASNPFSTTSQVYEHVYNTVEEEGSVSGKATATAKATIAAFAASEGQGHPRIVELEKVVTHTHTYKSQ